MTRITRAGRGAWLAAGLILAAVLYPVGAGAFRAHTAATGTPASQIKAAEGNPANWITVQALHLGACRSIYTASSQAVILKQMATDDTTIWEGGQDSSAIVRLYAETPAQVAENGTCYQPALIYEGNVWPGQPVYPFTPGFGIPSGLTLYATALAGEQVNFGTLHLQGILVPSTAVSATTKVITTE